jgi:alternative squalene epoxidase
VCVTIAVVYVALTNDKNKTYIRGFYLTYVAVHTIMTTNNNSININISLTSKSQTPAIDKTSSATASSRGSSSSTEKLNSAVSFFVSHLLAWSSILIWPCMIFLPLTLTTQHSPLHYTKIFPSDWYDTTVTVIRLTSTNTATAAAAADIVGTNTYSIKPLGLILGIVTVAIGQVLVWIIFYLFKYGYLTPPKSTSPILRQLRSTLDQEKVVIKPNVRIEPTSIQTKGSPQYEFLEGVMTHISQPEGFVVLTAYLSITWMFNMLPQSYYQFTNLDGTSGTIQYKELIFCLIVQDAIQYVMHRLEHDLSPTLYQKSHKPHHKFLNPRLFDAFNGSLTDTVCMIILPLFMTANIVRTANVWTYMAFGSTYASWLTLIHSEYAFVWDPYFRIFGLGTPADHHVHHAFFKYNYGHLFMWFDQLAGTYQHPKRYVPKNFNEGV